MIGNLQEILMKSQVENPLDPPNKREVESSGNETSLDANSSIVQSEPRRA